MIRSVQSEYQNYNAMGNDGKRFICYKRAIGIVYPTLKAKQRRKGGEKSFPRKPTWDSPVEDSGSHSDSVTDL